MGTLAALGVGLSVLFGAFLVVLVVEIYYMVCWRRSGGGGGSNNRVNDVQGMEEEAGAAGLGCYTREAALVGSFGGYPTSLAQSNFVAKFFQPGNGDNVVAAPVEEYIPDQFPPPFTLPLFTITEETKEEMELHKLQHHVPKANSATSATPSRSSSSSASSSFVASSSAGGEQPSADSDTTPFFTPPSSASNSLSSSPTSVASPSTAVSRFSPAPLHSVLAASPASSPSHLRRSSSASTSSPFSTQRNALGSLFRQPASPRSLFSPTAPTPFAALRSTRSSLVVDFRNALPFSPQDPPLRTVRSSPFAIPGDLEFLTRVGRNRWY